MPVSTPSEDQSLPGAERAVVVDARGQRCPLPLLAMRKAIREHPAGTLLRVEATDPGSWRDFHSFAELSQHTLERAEKHDDYYCYWLRIAARAG